MKLLQNKKINKLIRAIDKYKFESSVPILIQLNGHITDKMYIQPNLKHNKVEKKAKARFAVMVQLLNKTILKSIVVPNHSINFIIK